MSLALRDIKLHLTAQRLFFFTGSILHLVLSTHNKDLISNGLMRPYDCFEMKYNEIKGFDETPDRKIRNEGTGKARIPKEEI